MRKGTKQPLDASLKPPSDIESTITIKRPIPANGVKSDEVKSGEIIRGDGAVSQQLSARPTDEYVSAGGYVWLARYIKALPFYIDDTTRDFGDDLYERMMLDPQISSCMNVLKSAVLAEGIELTQIEDEDQEVPTLGGPTAGKRTIKAASDQSKEIADFCRRNLDNLARPLAEVAWELLDALAVGNKIGEMVYRIAQGGQDAGKLCLGAIKIKPRRSYSFVVDVYFNVLGIIGLIPGQGAPVIVESIIGEPGQIPNLLPRQKFVVYTNRGEVGDPRGQSDLRPAYNAWWTKMQTWGEYMKYIAQFASPSLWAETAPNAQTYTDPVSGLVQQPEQVLLATLMSLRNGSVVAVPNGAKITPIEMRGEGAPFLQSIDLSDRQITKAILYQTLATEEGQHMARAASETHQDILGLRIRTIKRTLAEVIRRDVLKPLVEYNYGKDAAAELTPTVSLGQTEHQDFAEDAKAVAALVTSGFMHRTQFPETDTMLSLPARDVEAQNAEIEAEEKMIQESGQLAADTAQQTDKTLARQQGKKTAGRVAAEVDQ